MVQQPDLFQQPPQERLAEFHVRNQKLFSSYYLAYKLPQRSLWRELEADAQQAFGRVKKAYQDMAAANLFTARKEAETERTFIQPTFKAIGFEHFSVQPDLVSFDAKRWPDYALFPDRESYEAAQQDRENMAYYYGKAVAIGEAKYWARPMNDRDLTDPVDTSDATKQIVGYLRDVAEWTDGKTNWGVLTNGTLWRLFHRRAGYTAENYIEIDLETIIQENNLEAFKYFYALFSHEAFIIQPVEGISWLESYLQGGEDYSTGITKHLKELIFEKVFDGLVQGFVQYRREQLGIIHEDQASKRAILQGCLTLLYRLLFLLNAESRQLLPLDNQGYRERSLRALMERIWEERGERRTEYDFDYWNHLRRLFKLIDNGASEFNLPRYNGGLFKRPDQNKPLDQLKEEEVGPWFLEKHELADPYLRDAIEQLTFDPEAITPSARAFIDYSSLGVRHLGEIYEGLLEFKVEIAEDEPVCAVGSKKKPQWKKQSKVKAEDTVHFIKQIDEPYITNDKGERKATGSYYTPHYIVEYIVEHTIGPQLDRFEREKEWCDRITSADADLQELYEEIIGETAFERERLDKLWKACKNDKEQRAFLINSLDPDPEAKHDFDSAARALELKVLDPAMGSGHFLVHAVDVIADRVADFLNKYPDSPVVKQLEQLRADILENVREQAVQIDESTLNDVNLVKRMVMKRCIYGVDLNPMAVELAKLSLWLDSFTVGAPLSFLNHHLRCGNSLIGATVEEVKTALEGEKRGEHLYLSLLTSQFTGLMRAVELMQQVGELSDATIPELEKSQTRYERAISQLAPFKALLDVWVSEHFQNDLAQETLKQAPEAVEKAVHYLLGRGDHLDSKSEAMLPIVQKTLATSKERRFFHWELEFPEVWYKGGKRRVNPGFDAVIGNPPYIPFQMLSNTERDFYRVHFDYFVMKGDIYILFLEQVMRLTAKRRFSGLIVQNKWLHAAYGEKARTDIFEHQTVTRLINFHDSPVFSISAYPLIVIRRKSSTAGQNPILERDIKTSDGDRIAALLLAEQESVPRLSMIKSRFSTSCVTLGEFAAQIGQGVLTGFAEAFVDSVTDTVIQENALEKAYIKPVLRASDIDSYSLVPGTGLARLIYPYDDDGHVVQQEQMPKIIDYLRRYRANLLARKNYGSRLIDQGYVWYELKHSAAGMFQPKLLWPEISDRNRFAFDSKGNLACLGSVYFLIRNNTLQSYASQFLLTLLNSRFLDDYFEEISPKIRGGYNRYQSRYVAELPIRRIFFTTSEAERAEQVKKFQELYQQQDFDQLLRAVEACLPKEDDGEFAVLSSSIPVQQAIEKGFLTEEQAESWALESGDPSGYDKNGNPLERSDIVHGLLAYLAERMIEMNKDKRELIERFWTDLEGVTDSEVFEALRKGKQER